MATVVFVTSYMLILPAITLEHDKAAEMGGISVPASDVAVEESVESEPEDIGDLPETDQNSESPDTAKEQDPDKSESADVTPDDDKSSSPADAEDEPLLNNSSEEPRNAQGESNDEFDERNEENTEKVDNVPASGLEYVGEGYTITVIDKYSVLPEDTEIRVHEIIRSEEEDEYDGYYNDALEALQAEDDDKQINELAFAKFYDISLISEGSEIKEPGEGVSVRIEYDKDQAQEMSVVDPDSVKIIHFAQDETSGKTQPEILKEENVEVSVKNNAMTEAVFEADSFSVYAVLSTTIEKNILTRDGRNYKITVTYGPEAEVPEGADLEVSEITSEDPDYNDYIEKTEKSLGWEPGSSSYSRLFDITIVDKNNEKVMIKAPVDVRIELDDKETDKDFAANTQVVHFEDGKSSPDVISNVEVDGKAVSFAADGFSAYAIVQGPEAGSAGWNKVQSIAELISMGSTGVYIGHPGGYYYGNTLTGDSSRMGIVKTKPPQSYPADNAAKYYFEEVPGTSNQVYAYCYAPDGTTKQYVFNGGNNSLSFTTEANKTAFTITLNNDGTFKLNNGAWYWNMQGGANGTRFCSYNSANDVNNNVNFWYYTETTEDPYGLDGTSYGLMFWDDSLYGKAMMASSQTAAALDAKALMVLATANNKKQLFVPNDSDISMWTFHWAQEDKYYLTATVDGSTKYLKISSDGLSLVNSESEASPVEVVPGTGAHSGQICLKSGNTTLTYSGKTETGFNTGGSVGSEWLNLVETSELTSDYLKTYSASKVSVSDESVTTGSKVIVYTRAWNETTLKYEYYAIDHDGKLVRCYENGDSIEWVGNIINTMLWQFTEYTDDNNDPTYFYELYNEYAQKYLAPQVTDGQIISDSTIGINMNGRRYGQYYSSIVAWDEDNYSYAGLKVENGKIVSCPKAEAMDFYFAVMQDIPVDDELTPVKTVDHTQYGITMKMVDFNSKVETHDDTPTTKEQHEVMGTSVFSKWNAQPGLLSTNLVNGYPIATKTNKSLAQLFDGTNTKEVNHLFIQSTYNASGYYEYDSSQNFASLNGANGGTYTPDFTGDFTVYKQLGTYDGSNKDTLKHGQFLPYNNIEAGRFASVNKQNLYSTTGALLPDSDPRKYENLYLVNRTNNNNADLYFGVELEASFTQTPDGLDDWGHDIIFEFTGDDDFWLYVDGELVIDLGGVHSALPGSVNFRTGAVNVNGTQTTLLDLFRDNYKKRNSITDNNDPRLINHLKEYFEYDEATGKFSNIFKSYSNHKMNIFYMERGGGASNLHMRFNLASVKPGTVELSKKLSGIDESESTMAEAYYQIKYKRKNDETEYTLTNGVDGKDFVFYKNTNNPVTFNGSKTIGGVSYENVFTLKPDETAVINFPTFGDANEEFIESYSIIECGVNTDVYNRVSVNGTEIEGTAVAGAADRKDYGIGFVSTEDRPRVTYENNVDPTAMRTLTFRKNLYDADGTTQIHTDSTVFDFRLYFGTESDTKLAAANMYTYHVKDKNGNYCSWDKQNKRFVMIGEGITDYSQLTPEQKIAASFSTSMYGSITKIPIDYTVEVRQILAGTKYEVQERPYEIPDGYSFQKYVYYDNYDPTDPDTPDPTATYSGGDPVAEAGAPDGASHDGTYYNVIAPNKDPHVDVCNLKGWGLRVNKVWTDADYMEGRDDTYFAVYTKDSSEQLTIIPDSLRKLPYGTDTLYWYWLKLPVTDVSFSNYKIREVKITNGTPVFDDDGIITNQDSLTIVPIGEGGELKLNGTQKGESSESEFTYSVRYVQGEISVESNVRVDTVTNDRPGILLKKQDWDGNALEGASFTLKDSAGEEIGTFTSDEGGIITTAFLSENKEYILTETTAPQGYHGLEKEMSIEVISNGSGSQSGNNGSTVTVSGPDAEYYDLTQASGTTPATLIIKNRPYIFKAVKQDGKKKKKLSGVHFGLHKLITVGGITTFDEAEMTGYEDLVSNSDGSIPKIDNTLPAGTYQLREKTPLRDYQPLPGHVEFTVSKTGQISLLPSMSSSDWVQLDGPTESEGTLVYTMIIKNYLNASVTLKKVDATGTNLLGSKFRLCKYGTSWEVVSDYSDIDLTTVNSIELKKLSVGRYRLEETHAPNGYLILNKYTYFNIDQSGKASLTDESGTGSNSNPEASISNNRKTITVKNIPGTALPVTGGSGTALFYVLGSILIVIGAAGLIIRRRKMSR